MSTHPDNKEDFVCVCVCRISDTENNQHLAYAEHLRINET